MIQLFARAKPLLALLLIVALAVPAGAQLVDAQLVAGHRFSGQLEDGKDIDIVALEGLAAEVVTIQVKAGKGGPGDLLIEVVDVTNATTIASGTGSKVKLNKLELPGTGIYHIRISSQSGQMGPYSVKTKGKPDKAGLKPDSAPSGSGPSGSIEIKFQGRKGMELKAKVKPTKKTEALAGTPTLTGPDGPVDISDYIKLKKGKLSLKKVPITAFGEWTLYVPNWGGPGTLEAKTSLKSKPKGDVAENDYAFDGALMLTPDLAFVGEFTQATALISLTDETTDPNDVSIVRVTDDGEEFVAKLWDDGILGSHGDEIEGDRIFTGSFVFTPAEEGTETYRVVAGFGVGGKARSLGVDILEVVLPSDSELNAAMAQADSLQGMVDQAVLDDDVDAVLANLLADLQADPTIDEAGYAEGGQGLWYIDENGIPSVVYAAADGVKSGGVVTADPDAPLVLDRGQPVMPVLPGVDRHVDWQPYDLFYDLPKATPPADDTMYAASAPAENLIDSNKVLGIAAQHFDWGDNDDIPKIVEKFQENKCFETTYVKYGSQGAGDVEDFKNLGNYGVVLISSHGDSFYSGAAAGSRFGWNNTAQGVVVIDSNQKINLTNLKTYIKDVLKGRLVIWGDTYGVSPTFVTTYSGKMPNTLVYMSICRGTFNATLANAFTGAGAGAFLGYSDYVAVSFCVSNGPPVFDKLLMSSDNTLDDAFTAGITETDSDPAEFKLFGSKTLKIKPGLKDGSFEAGNLNAAWTTSGDARIVGGLGGFGPTEGSRMAIISTGLGFTTSSGSFSQTVCLGEKDKKLSFSWNYFSEEFLEYCDSQFQDTFRVTIQDVEGGGTTTLFNRIVDDLCGSVSPASVSFDQGDVHVTGWKNQTVSIPNELKGKKVKIAFECFDVGDSIYDTAILVDGIEIK